LYVVDKDFNTITPSAACINFSCRMPGTRRGTFWLDQTDRKLDNPGVIVLFIIKPFNTVKKSGQKKGFEPGHRFPKTEKQH